MANAILLVTFVQQRRINLDQTREAVVEGAGSRLRAVLMTSSGDDRRDVTDGVSIWRVGPTKRAAGPSGCGWFDGSHAVDALHTADVFGHVTIANEWSIASLDPDDPTSRHFTGQA